MRQAAHRRQRALRPAPTHAALVRGDRQRSARSATEAPPQMQQVVAGAADRSERPHCLLHAAAATAGGGSSGSAPTVPAPSPPTPAAAARAALPGGGAAIGDPLCDPATPPRDPGARHRPQDATTRHAAAGHHRPARPPAGTKTRDEPGVASQEPVGDLSRVVDVPVRPELCQRRPVRGLPLPERLRPVERENNRVPPRAGLRVGVVYRCDHERLLFHSSAGRLAYDPCTRAIRRRAPFHSSGRIAKRGRGLRACG